MVELLQVRGQLRTVRQQVIVLVVCPECRQYHQYTLGRHDDPRVRALIRRGWEECWMPCRLDLPGNAYRVIFSWPGGGNKQRRG